MIDVATLQGWIEKLGFSAELHDPTTLLIRPPSRRGDPTGDIPPFYVQCTDNWVLLSILPIIEADDYFPRRGRKLLAQNREMRLAKFALDKNGAIVLCAELPTESLDRSEVVEAVERMVEYARQFQANAPVG